MQSRSATAPGAMPRDYLDFRGDMMKAVKAALDKAGVSMPHAALQGASPAPDTAHPDDKTVKEKPS